MRWGLQAPGHGGRRPAKPTVSGPTGAPAQLEWKADDTRGPRELGFTTVLAAPAAGVFRGQSALLATHPRHDAKTALESARVAQHMGFETLGETGSDSTSLMNAMALAIRLPGSRRS